MKERRQCKNRDEIQFRRDKYNNQKEDKICERVDSFNMHNKVKERARMTKKNNRILMKEGIVTWDPTQRINRWENYIKELFVGEHRENSLDTKTE